jgi:hypothetical protein
MNTDGAQELYEAIKREPGYDIGFYAKTIEARRKAAERRLVTLEILGLLLSEDEQGGLWPFIEAPDGAKG